MNQRDRARLGRVYEVLSGTSGLRARNPTDIKTISRYHAEMDRILRPLGFALIDLSAGDYEMADENLDDAERELQEAKARA